ncbi:MAG: hypothetical protein HN534_00640 [Euryarchaeota archaeon]|jgi:hypothetical protein|nr:hypothetical protein [Euryarchaeota archaeon]MBT4650604.1 hypothetical protein [Euryarchaeota archaeon]MBT4962189.1 hypothetical protein [Euryarchaeota archaeon]MBT5279539.1 hypothetical protein [Euryarchaeota archaeon]MBT5508594.1 hypothetical protein [Euryarchaeota archaeon]|tara:strand:- start:4290 stop:4676 length:387 start_codon:yes stop_codon:yes gene_type:complete
MPILETFLQRKLIVGTIAFFKKYLKRMVIFFFGSFKKMPIRVGLAIIGSIFVVISFVFGAIFSNFSLLLFEDDIWRFIRSSLYLLLTIIIFWISITTFIPSLERQPTVVDESVKLPSPEIDEDKLLEA